MAPVRRAHVAAGEGSTNKSVTAPAERKTMNICIPITEDQGLRSPVSEHFGSAAFFMLVDTDTRACRVVPNGNPHHSHGVCQPLAALAGERFDGLVVGGIGAGALQRLQAAGIRVYLVAQASVEQVLLALQDGSLPEATATDACCGHQHGHHGHSR